MKKISLCFLSLVLVLVTLVTGCVAAEPAPVEPVMVTLYLNGDNNQTIVVPEEQVAEYTKDWVWSIEPTTLMYAADGRTTWIWNSEVELYKTVCWSTYPPVTIYGKNGATRSCLVEEKQAYLDSGYWFATYEEANPGHFTYNVFEKSNLSVDQLYKILEGTKVQKYAQDFYDMEQTYGVNSLFCLSVSIVESGGGAKNANVNNFFGFRGGRGWMAFSTPRAGIFYFGELMNKKLYYGKSIEQIATIYCNSAWGPAVKKVMQQRWNKLNK